MAELFKQKQHYNLELNVSNPRPKVKVDVNSWDCYEMPQMAHYGSGNHDTNSSDGDTCDPFFCVDGVTSISVQG